MIFQAYTCYIPVIYIQKVYTWYIPGIYLAYDHLVHVPGIYPVPNKWICSVPVTYPSSHVISQEYPWGRHVIYVTVIMLIAFLSFPSAGFRGPSGGKSV